MIKFTDEEGNLKIFKDTLSADAKKNKCNDNSYFYIQTPCLVPEERKVARLLFGLSFCCIGVFLYLYVQLFIQYIAQREENLYVDYDVRTITAADYSIEFPIS